MMMRYMLIFALIQYGLCFSCYSNTGPSGVTLCIQISRYNNEYQWGVCLTNTYIRIKSNFKHRCLDQTATYCVYQCMLEIYNINSGPVNDDCSCNKGDEYTQTNLTLPSECYSPSGTDCTWYKDCLGKKYKCSGTDDDYAMEYATKFCNLYSDNYDWFSSSGQKWVDSVRKCLQVSLVPTIRPWKSLTCEEVKRTAFDSHVPCYTNPDKNDPSISICNLNYKDRGRIFWTLKSSLVMSVESSLETMDGFRKTLLECYPVLKKIPYRLIIHLTIRIVILRGLPIGRRRRSVSNSDLKVLALSNKIAENIAEKLNWRESGVLWFPEVEQNSTISDEIDVYLYLAEAKTYIKDLQNTPAVDMNKTMSEFQSKAKNGELEANIGDHSFKLLSAEGCLDFQCNNTLFNVTARYEEKDKTSNNKLMIIGIVAGSLLLMILVGVMICWQRRNKGIV